MEEYKSSRIIDSNGEKYRVGWDNFGAFSVERVERHPEKDEWVAIDDFPRSFTPEAAGELYEAIEEGL